jgi:hypothetical protein
VAERLNFLRYLSHFRSVHRGAFFAEIRTTTVRKLLPDAWGTHTYARTRTYPYTYTLTQTHTHTHMHTCAVGDRVGTRGLWWIPLCLYVRTDQGVYFHVPVPTNFLSLSVSL